jgi:hypothetical protein
VGVYSEAWGSPPDPITPQLFTSDGAPVDGTVADGPLGLRTFRPRQMLELGRTYELRWTDAHCSQLGPAPRARMSRFTVGPEAPLPTRLGAVTVSPAIRDQRRFSCLPDPVDVVARRVDIAPDPALAPWLPLTVWEVRADGAAWANGKQGVVSADGTIAKDAHFGGDVGDLYTVCSAADDAPTGLAPGPHHIDVVASLPGSAVTLSATIETTLSCGSASGCSVAPPDRVPLTAIAFALGAVALALLRCRLGEKSPIGSNRRGRETTPRGR